MATFLWTLEWGGLTIALLGMGRERWLARRRRRIPTPAKV